MSPDEPPGRGDSVNTISDSTVRVDSDVSPRPFGLGDILLVTGEGRLQTFSLDRREIVIGRAPDCDVVVDHRTLSRRHARLTLGPVPTIQDLDSKNGVLVARQLRRGGEPVRLQVGEGFGIGAFTFVLMYASHGRAGSEVPPGPEPLRILDPMPEQATPLVQDIAASDATVLILGETGVGKEVLANTIHQLSGRSGPMVRINCAALSESLLESELFGHEKGAFTGATSAKPGLLESAQGGTVFLDEVGELPPALQAKLLRALEAREVLRVGSVKPIEIDARFVAATNRDLVDEVAAGRFRSDLYFRLDGISLHIPPLRERRHVIVRLAMTFLADGEREAPRLTTEAATALEHHDWPGNVRELRAAMQRAVLLARGGEIGAAHLPLAQTARLAERMAAPARAAAVPAAAADPTDDDVPAGLSPEEREERARIIEVLQACAGNQTRAARELGMSRTTLVGRLKLYRIPRPRRR